MKISVHPVHSFTGKILDWQKQRVQLMSGPCDMYWLKKIVYGGMPYILKIDDIDAGYCVLTQDKELSEIFLTPAFQKSYTQILTHLIAEKLATASICNTRDPFLLNSSLDLNQRVIPLAYLFTDVSPDLDFKCRLNFRLAKKDDADWLIKHTEYARDFDSDLHNEAIYIFDFEGERIGCGTLSLNYLQKEYVDVGVQIAPAFQNKGFGREILRALKQICYEKNKIPVCGCDCSNISSKRMIESSGFIATGRMVKILF